MLKVFNNVCRREFDTQKGIKEEKEEEGFENVGLWGWREEIDVYLCE